MSLLAAEEGPRKSIFIEISILTLHRKLFLSLVFISGRSLACRIWPKAVVECRSGLLIKDCPLATQIVSNLQVWATIIGSHLARESTASPVLAKW